MMLKRAPTSRRKVARHSQNRKGNETSRDRFLQPASTVDSRSPTHRRADFFLPVRSANLSLDVESRQTMRFAVAHTFRHRARARKVRKKSGASSVSSISQRCRLGLSFSNSRACAADIGTSAYFDHLSSTRVRRRMVRCDRERRTREQISWRSLLVLANYRCPLAQREAARLGY
jgi:hypothetical protein